jgi:hypothetical protein
MQVVYNPATWDQTTPWQKLALAIEAFTNCCNEQRDRYLAATSQTRLTWDGRDDYAGRVELGIKMLEHYVLTIHPVEDSNLKPVKTEVKFQVPLFDPETGDNLRCWNTNCGQKHDLGDIVVHEGRIDVIFEDLEHGGYLVGDWKAQPLDTTVLTLEGRTTLGALSVGSEIVGRDGKAQKVIGVYPQGRKQVYKITTRDGSVTRATGEHLWSVGTSYSVKDKVLTTEQVKDELAKKCGGYYFLPELEPIEYTEKQYDVDPYVLGLLIGDGGMSTEIVRFTNGDGLVPKLMANAPNHWSLGFYDGKYGHTIRGAIPDMRNLGLMGHLSINKFIPETYKRGSIAQRLALLAGLMDTDGGTEKGNSKFYTTSHQLARDVKELVDSLGGRGFIWIRDHTRKGGTVPECVVTVYLPNNANPFTLERKASTFTPSRNKNRKKIISIEPDSEEETLCIRVSNSDSLYVVDDHLLTHNTVGGDKAVDGNEKNTNRFSQDNLVWSHDQLSTYCAVLRYVMNLDVRGFILAEIRKDYPKPPVRLRRKRNGGIFSQDKNMSTTYDIYLQTVKKEDFDGLADGAYDEFLEFLQSSEAPIFHKRFRREKNTAELKEVLTNVSLEVQDMIDKGVRIWAAPGPITCPRCVFRGPCEMKMRGLDYEFTLNSDYVKEDRYPE